MTFTSTMATAAGVEPRASCDRGWLGRPAAHAHPSRKRANAGTSDFILGLRALVVLLTGAVNQKCVGAALFHRTGNTVSPRAFGNSGGQRAGAVVKLHAYAPQQPASEGNGRRVDGAQSGSPGGGNLAARGAHL